MLRIGWTSDLSVLAAPTLVIRAQGSRPTVASRRYVKGTIAAEIVVPARAGDFLAVYAGRRPCSTAMPPALLAS